MGLFSKLRVLFGGKGAAEDKNKNLSELAIVGTKPSFSFEQNVELNSQYCSCRNFLAKQVSMIEVFAAYKGKLDPTMKDINRLFTDRPNPIQTPSEFLYTVASSYFGDGIAIVQIVYDLNMTPAALFPVDTGRATVSHSGNELYITFYDQSGNKITLNANDLLVLVRKPNADNPLYSTDRSLEQVVEVINANYKGLENAVIQSHLIRYIVTWPSVVKDSKAIRQDFSDQLSSDTDGMVVLSHGEKFTPITSQATYAKQPEMDDLSDQIYSYFGLTKNMLESSVTDTQHHYMMQYDIMPFVNTLCEEATYKFFTERERGYGNSIMCVSEPLSKSSLDTKYKIASLLKDSGYYTPNELRRLVGADEIQGGDELVHSLNFTGSGTTNSEQNNEHSDKMSKEGTEDTSSDEGKKDRGQGAADEN